MPARDRRVRADELLADLELRALAERRPSTLSGGESQKVALARALAADPRALLLDEPLAALDVGVRRQVRAFAAATLARLSVPALVVTHDLADAAALGARIAVLEGGTVKQIGTVDDLRAHPASPFVEELLHGSDLSGLRSELPPRDEGWFRREKAGRRERAAATPSPSTTW